MTQGKCAAAAGVGADKAGRAEPCRQCSGVGNGTLDRCIHLRRQKSSPNSENTTPTRGDTTAAYIYLHCEAALEEERRPCRLQSRKTKVVKGFISIKHNIKVVITVQTSTNFILKFSSFFFSFLNERTAWPIKI